jgi:hypothetical protein|tara:strand:+ start:7441 stop:7758 length:318 start_codon:yes stop_codon:yes gene_type:complete
MKSYIIFAIGVLSLGAFLLTSTNTDPFGLKSDVQAFTSLNPSVAYAASSSIVDGYQPAASNLIIWHTDDDSAPNQTSLRQDDIDALCESPSLELKEHPSYKRWCL